MIVVPSPSPSPIKRVECSRGLFASKPQNNTEIRDLRAVHSIVATGKLSQLLEFYKLFSEPQQFSNNFIYTWIATESPLASSQCSSEELERVSRSVSTFLDASLAMNLREDSILQLPQHLFPLVVAHIPLSKLKQLQLLSQVFAKSESKIIYSQIMNWKLSEKATLLYEFFSNRGTVDRTKEEILPQFSSLRDSFGDISFILRTLTLSSKVGMKTKFAKENIEIRSCGKAISEVVHNFQISEEGTIFKRHSLDIEKNVRQPELEDISYLLKHQPLFREPTKMCFIKGNASPIGYDWFPLLNQHSLDHFLVTERAPESAA